MCLLVRRDSKCAASALPADARAGVVSTSTAVELINSITGAVHLKQLSRHDLIKRVFTLLVGEVDSLGEDELLVRLTHHALPLRLTPPLLPPVFLGRSEAAGAAY